MPALLIVSGVFLIAVGWVWVAVAARRLPIARTILAAVAAPLTILLRGRGYARLPRLLMVAGLLLALAGAALLQREQPDRFSRLLSGEWASTGQGVGIEGELMGQPFSPDRVLWRGNDLVLEEGPPQRVRRALAIRFDPAELPAGFRAIDRLPGDSGPWPELLLQWHAGSLSQPGLLRVTDNYSLSLDLVPMGDNTTQLGLRLHLPTTPATLVSGYATVPATPAWLARQQEAAPTATEAAPAASPAPAAPVATVLSSASQWQDVSVLAVVDEPAFFIGQQLRLTTQAGRQYEGRLKSISEDRRIVLAQNSGANQVDYHFRPVDVAQLQVRYGSTR